MLGAIVGDIVGSPYEFHNIKRTDFPFLTKYNRFTDDSVMTLANAKWLTEDPSHSPEHLVKCMRELGRAAQGVGYGPSFCAGCICRTNSHYHTTVGVMAHRPLLHAYS